MKGRRSDESIRVVHGCSNGSRTTMITHWDVVHVAGPDLVRTTMARDLWEGKTGEAKRCAGWKIRNPPKPQPPCWRCDDKLHVTGKSGYGPWPCPACRHRYEQRLKLAQELFNARIALNALELSRKRVGVVISPSTSGFEGALRVFLYLAAAYHLSERSKA